MRTPELQDKFNNHVLLFLKANNFNIKESVDTVSSTLISFFVINKILTENVLEYLEALKNDYHNYVENKLDEENK